MKVVVQKYGGTSLNSKELRNKAVDYIQEKISEGLKPIIVVSAIGRYGEPYATDTLLEFVQNEYEVIEPREKDLLLSCGELISAVLLTQSLQAKGIKAVALSGSQAAIVTDSNFGNARVKKIIPSRIKKILQNDGIPVIAGFQGIDENGDITTLSRGGSDTTASLIAAAMKAESIEIYSDVDGVRSADPKIVDKSKLLKNCSYDEIVELADKGAKIIHPRAVEIALQADIPIHIRSLNNHDKSTFIHKIKYDKPVTGIISKNDISYVQINIKNNSRIPQELQIFELLAKSNISVDFIDIRGEGISFIVEKDLRIKVENVLTDRHFDFSIQDNFAKVSVVGSGMTGQPGIISKIVNILSANGIQIFECTDSHTTISCLVEEESMKLAIQKLHQEFIEENDED